MNHQEWKTNGKPESEDAQQDLQTSTIIYKVSQCFGSSMLLLVDWLNPTSWS